MPIIRHRPEPLSREQIDRLEQVAALPDDRIDFSDIPDSDAGYDVARRARGRFYRPVKKQTTLRVDADVLDWFKRRMPGGRGYQTAINQALREYVAAHDKDAG